MHRTSNLPPWGLGWHPKRQEKTPPIPFAVAHMPPQNFPACRQAGLLLFLVIKKEESKNFY